MEKNIYIIVDISGGFLEEGKASLQRNLLLTLKHAILREEYKAFQFAFLQWNDELEEILNNETIKFSQSADIDLLEELIEGTPDKSRFLLLSDGIISKSVRSLKETIIRKEAIVIPVAVGADCDDKKLEELAIPFKKYFRAVNILTALQELCFRNFVKIGEESKIKTRRRLHPRRI